MSDAALAPSPRAVALPSREAVEDFLFHEAWLADTHAYDDWLALWDQDAVYRKHSPMFHVKGVTTPTLIQHGEKDDRVPIGQGYELYHALKRQGCTTKMVVYPRTPHGPGEPRLFLDVMNRNVEWFDRYLK